MTDKQIKIPEMQVHYKNPDQLIRLLKEKHEKLYLLKIEHEERIKRGIDFEVSFIRSRFLKIKEFVDSTKENNRINSLEKKEMKNKIKSLGTLVKNLQTENKALKKVIEKDIRERIKKTTSKKNEDLVLNESEDLEHILREHFR